ncbi:MAG: Ig-like domain-containing protein [[Eubacterium] siraeum]
MGNPTDSEKSVKWNSSAPKTVSVKDGVITALKAGTATITASVSDSISDSIEITVTDLLRAPKITATKPLFSRSIQ